MFCFIYNNYCNHRFYKLVGLDPGLDVKSLAAKSLEVKSLAAKSLALAMEVKSLALEVKSLALALTVVSLAPSLAITAPPLSTRQNFLKPINADTHHAP